MPKEGKEMNKKGESQISFKEALKRTFLCGLVGGSVFAIAVMVKDWGGSNIAMAIIAIILAAVIGASLLGEDILIVNISKIGNGLYAVSADTFGLGWIGWIILLIIAIVVIAFVATILFLAAIISVQFLVGFLLETVLYRLIAKLKIGYKQLFAISSPYYEKIALALSILLIAMLVPSLTWRTVLSVIAVGIAASFYIMLLVERGKFRAKGTVIPLG